MTHPEKHSEIDKALGALNNVIKNVDGWHGSLGVVQEYLERAKADLSMDKLKADCAAAHEVFDTVDIGKSLEAGEVVRKADLADGEGVIDRIVSQKAKQTENLIERFMKETGARIEDCALEHMMTDTGFTVRVINRRLMLQDDATPQANKAALDAFNRGIAYMYTVTQDHLFTPKEIETIRNALKGIT